MFNPFRKKYVEQLIDLRLIDSGYKPPKKHTERIKQATESYINKIPRGSVRVVSPEYSIRKQEENQYGGTQVFGITKDQETRFFEKYNDAEKWAKYKQPDPIVATNNKIEFFEEPALRTEPNKPTFTIAPSIPNPIIKMGCRKCPRIWEISINAVDEYFSQYTDIQFYCPEHATKKPLA